MTVDVYCTIHRHYKPTDCVFTVKLRPQLFLLARLAHRLEPGGLAWVTMTRCVTDMFLRRRPSLRLA